MITSYEFCGGNLSSFAEKFTTAERFIGKTFYPFHAPWTRRSLWVSTVPYFSLRSSRVEAEGGGEGGGGWGWAAEGGRQEKYFSSPTPIPLVDLILFSRLNSARPFETKKVRVTISKVWRKITDNWSIR